MEKNQLIYQYGWYKTDYAYGNQYRIHTIRFYLMGSYHLKDKHHANYLGTSCFEVEFQSNCTGEDTKTMYGFKLKNFEIGDCRFKEDVKLVAKVSKAFYEIGGHSKTIRDLAMIMKRLTMKRAKYNRNTDLFFIR